MTGNLYRRNSIRLPALAIIAVVILTALAGTARGDRPNTVTPQEPTPILKPVEVDLRLRAVFESQCDAGIAHDCTAFGIQLFGGKAGPKDYVRAVKVLTRGCDLGDLEACWLLGVSFVDGLGVMKGAMQEIG